MTCEHVQKRLTAYLDGELDGDRGSVVRGHLRACATCRQIASDEAALRDGLRQLPPVDPPASLWAGVQARLAEAEVADAKRPAWRRALARWAPLAPRYALGGLVAAAAVTAIWWRTHRDADPEQATATPSQVLAADTTPAVPATALAVDISADLAAESDRITATYAETAAELLALASERRHEWAPDEQQAFDAQVAALRSAIDDASAERPRHRAWRSLIRYLQNAVVRDQIALAGGAP